MDFAAFVADRKTVYAVVRAPEVVSEASRRLPGEIRDWHAEMAHRLKACATMAHSPCALSRISLDMTAHNGTLSASSWFPPAAAVAGVYYCLRADAGFGHRGQHGHLHPG